MMRVLRIIAGTTVDGPGLRTSIYFAGCAHHCPECHNPESWDFTGGEEKTIDEIVKQVEEEDFDVTFSGGDPLYQIESLVDLAKMIKALGKTIWCFTGYKYEEVVADQRLATILPYIDVLVDGPYVAAQRDVKILFRGSKNQRLIDVAKSTLHCVVEIEE
ncbi:MAG: anaerobic ribonucleoside-triphosphate reductase activating protein [Muribaculum sp.]|nr:anaerobic ribonucleoside-triphosphate reductase activating protein [Muribaculum sp.]